MNPACRRLEGRRFGTQLGWLLCLAGLSFARPAAAFILPADAILEDIAERRNALGFKVLKLEGRRFQGQGEPKKVLELLKANQLVRLELTDPRGTLVLVTSGARRWEFTKGEAAGTPSRATPDLVRTFLASTELDAGGRRGIAFLTALEVKVDEVTLGRFEERAAFVIGAKPWELDRPQLWVDKELQVPVRLITKDRDGTLTDLRLIDYRSPQTGEWFPQRIELWKNGSLIETTRYDRAEPNAAVEASALKEPTR